MTSVTVVTPWFNAPELAPAYWRAMSVLGEDDRCIVVDNGSPTPVADPNIEGVTIFRCNENLGFSPASNRGLFLAETDAVLFLNNDVQMTNVTWLEQIREALRKKRLVGAELRSNWHTRVDGKVHPYLDGWCLAGMTADLIELGGWDESLEEPSYYGDNLLCFRAKQAGFKLVQVSVGLRHLSNHTSKHVDVTGLSQRNYERYAAYVRANTLVTA